jgi:putative hemolysin
MQAQRASSPRSARNLRAFITRDEASVRAAQQLRYDIFSAEYGSDLGATEAGIDADRFDPACEHLVITNELTGELVATTRILHQRETANCGGFYSESEFDLSALKQVSGTFAELGRTCIHPDYRNGVTLGMLWTRVAEYLVAEKVDYLIGCASISMLDGGQRAWRIAQHLRQSYMADEAFRVYPHRELPHLAQTPTTNDQDISNQDISVPALIKAYMRLGALVCGNPCWDPDFRCADLLVMLEVDKLSARYARHFMRRETA